MRIWLKCELIHPFWGEANQVAKEMQISQTMRHKSASKGDPQARQGSSTKILQRSASLGAIPSFSSIAWRNQATNPDHKNRSTETGATTTPHPHPEATTTPQPHPEATTTPQPRICRDYRKQACKHGRRGLGCSYSHPRACPKLMEHGLDKKLGCSRGRNCRDFHPTICRNSIRNRACFNESCKFPHIKGTTRKREQTTRPTSTPPRHPPSPPPRHSPAKTAQRTDEQNATAPDTVRPADPQQSFLETFLERIMEMEKKQEKTLL